jgi:hypothetical protein
VLSAAGLEHLECSTGDSEHTRKRFKHMSGLSLPQVDRVVDAHCALPHAARSACACRWLRRAVARDHKVAALRGRGRAGDAAAGQGLPASRPGAKACSGRSCWRGGGKCGRRVCPSMETQCGSGSGHPRQGIRSIAAVFAAAWRAAEAGAGAGVSARSLQQEAAAAGSADARAQQR